MENEIWKDIPNYEGHYQVSNLGNVKSLKCGKIKLMKKTLSTDKYHVVSLSLFNKMKMYKVHQLVAMAFLNHIPNGNILVIDHINDNKIDNRLENIQVVTNRFNSHKTQGKYSSKYKGVSWDKKRKKWRSTIEINNKQNCLGIFSCELKAYYTYIQKVNQVTVYI